MAGCGSCYSTIGGGFKNCMNSATGSVSVSNVIAGGQCNKITGYANNSTIGGGLGNFIAGLGCCPNAQGLKDSPHNTIGGGDRNTICDCNGFGRIIQLEVVP